MFLSGDSAHRMCGKEEMGEGSRKSCALRLEIVPAKPRDIARACRKSGQAGGVREEVPRVTEVERASFLIIPPFFGQILNFEKGGINLKNCIFASILLNFEWSEFEEGKCPGGT